MSPRRAEEGAGNGGGGKWSGRRRKLALAATVGLVILVYICIPGRVPTNRAIALSFAGFTNYDDELHAFFWFTNGSQPTVSSLTSVSRKVGDAWVDDGEVICTIHQRLPDSDKSAVMDPPNQTQLISFPVREAKLPLRVITDGIERPPGWAGMKDAVQQWCMNHVQRTTYVIASGRTYSVTNEFWEQH